MLELAFYADDFTGSTDALESLATAGLRTALFLTPPTPAQLARHPELEAIGVAGLTRSLAPAAMETELRSAFAALRALAPKHAHYKVCSTFDSSPAVGSIGRAIEIGAEIFGGRYVPLLVGAPALGRYCVFGNLFARLGIGSTGEIYRLDRHPSMSRHPVTPADESDLRVHLSRQTNKRIGLLDFLQLSLPLADTRAALERLIADGTEIILLDALAAHQLPRLGALIDAETMPGKTVFSVGSSGVGAALTSHWSRSATAFSASAPLTSTQPLLVISGSCSPVTASQIAWAEASGFSIISLDPASFDLASATDHAIAELGAGRSTVVCTSRGHAGTLVSAATLGAALGGIARAVLERTGLRRLLIAGGDTSSYAGRALSIESLEMIAPLAPGAPLCRACAPGSPADGVEIVFKGGQVGAPDFFGAVARGRLG